MLSTPFGGMTAFVVCKDEADAKRRRRAAIMLNTENVRIERRGVCERSERTSSPKGEGGEIVVAFEIVGDPSRWLVRPTKPGRVAER